MVKQIKLAPPAEAEAERQVLEIQRLQADSGLRPILTRLNEDQVQEAEAAFRIQGVRLDLLTAGEASYDPRGRNLFRYTEPPPTPEQIRLQEESVWGLRCRCAEACGHRHAHRMHAFVDIDCGARNPFAEIRAEEGSRAADVFSR